MTPIKLSSYFLNPAHIYTIALPWKW